MDSDSDESEYSTNDVLMIHNIVEAGDTDLLLKQLSPTAGEGVRINEKDDMGCTALHTAVIARNLDCFAILLDAEARWSSKCNGSPLLQLILRVGSIKSNRNFAIQAIKKIMSMLEAMDEDTRNTSKNILGESDDIGNTAFHVAAMSDQHECCEILLQNLSHEIVNINNKEGNSPIHTAAKFSSVNVLNMLLNASSALVNSKNNFNQRPAHVAAKYGSIAVLKALREAGADFCTLDDYNRSPEKWASIRGNVKCAQFCLGVDVDQSLDLNSNDASICKIVYHSESLQHIPNARMVRGGEEPPPENPERIDTLVKEGMGILQSAEFSENDSLVWDHNAPYAEMVDILRVHEFHYVKKIIALSKSAQVNQSTQLLDADTSLSALSYDAARRAAGAVCHAIDQVCSGKARNAFAIVRPPGHHAGPVGKVTCKNDPEGSHGFCLFNNVAVGAAYARCMHRKSTGNSTNISKIAIVDFDVHHGNGTEEIIRLLRPSVDQLPFSTPYCQGLVEAEKYKPWLNEQDAENVLFASVHGYGKKDPAREFEPEVQDLWFYPGSGATCCPTATSEGDDEPLVINAGLSYVKGTASRRQWRQAFRDNVFPKLVDFKPDLILLSAGFDGHRREIVNWGYASVIESDFEWLTDHLVSISNAVCDGRLVSVLEGGYNFHGRIASAFARSVAAHVRSLSSGSQQIWTNDEATFEREREQQLLIDKAMQREERAAIKRAANGEVVIADGNELNVEQRSKRIKVAVDYTALAEKLEQEKKNEN